MYGRCGIIKNHQPANPDYGLQGHQQSANHDYGQNDYGLQAHQLH